MRKPFVLWKAYGMQMAIVGQMLALGTGAISLKKMAPGLAVQLLRIQNNQLLIVQSRNLRNYIFKI